MTDDQIKDQAKAVKKSKAGKAAKELAQGLLPHLDRSDIAIAAPGVGEGFWNGASSAVAYDDVIYLAYRTRQPIALGRGQGVVIAKSLDGVHFDTITTISKDSMDAESLERPTLIRTPDGRWRLYLSCATIASKHWRVELLEAESPDAFDASTRQVVMPGDDHWAVKDTVIQWRPDVTQDGDGDVNPDTDIREPGETAPSTHGTWHCWATFHPLDEANHEDRMVSRHATSQDGIDWTWQESTCLGPREGLWDGRGARITAVHFMADSDDIIAFYDGRASAAENYEERTGIAFGKSSDSFTAVGKLPYGQSPNERGLRYLDIVPLPNGGYRTYYEVATADDSHELRTELITTE